MANKMLIDAAHPEETRVVVVRGNRVEEFDFEAANRKQLRGNIYLAKVTRVEPSLQAAFVEYGGNRHGFLAFSEIHPDYYQIPVADRQALLDAENPADDKDDLGDEDEAPARKPRRGRRSKAAASRKDDTVASEAVDTDDSEDTAEATAKDPNAEADADANPVEASEGVTDEASDEDEAEAKASDNDEDDEGESDEHVESVGAEDALEELPVRRPPPRRQ